MTKNTSAVGGPQRILVHAFLVILAIASLLPLYNVAAASLKSAEEYTSNPFFLPMDPGWDNFEYVAIHGRLLRFALNSLLYVPIGLLVYLVVCLCAGYAFGKMRFAAKGPLFLLVLFLMIFPQLLLATQVFRVIAFLHLTNTGLGVVLTWVAYFAPFGTYIMTTYFTDMPFQLVEAARIDGATHLRILISVMTPLALPMIATVAIIGFQSMWNELPFSLLIIQEQARRTLTLGIAMLRGEYGLDVPSLSAALVVAMAMPLALFLAFQRHITLGVTAGALKG